jgi:hypothetical protein
VSRLPSLDLYFFCCYPSAAGWLKAFHRGLRKGRFVPEDFVVHGLHSGRKHLGNGTVAQVSMTMRRRE